MALFTADGQGDMMAKGSVFRIATVVATTFLLTMALTPLPTFAQEQVAVADVSGNTTETSPEPLSADELEVLVAGIALYPDELVALISGASLYPLQIVEAARYLDQYAKDKNLKPKENWDGSVVSLLNYPDVVKMMSEDLDWTQAFGNAIAYQQKDVLIAIQQLRDEAVAKGVIKSDDKVQVVHENENVVIRPANPEKVYVPQYPPQMFYEPDYVWEPISYYPDPYPPYWYPGAPFFAGVITGAFWGAIVDWDDWGIWGGDWDGGDLDIDCNNCFNNRDFNGKLNFNDIDWNNIDRDKLKFNRDQINQLDRGQLKDRVKQNGNNSLRNKAKDIKRAETRDRPGKAGADTRDVRKSVQDGLKQNAANRPANRPANANRPNAGDRPAAANRDAQRPAKKSASRQGGKPKAAKRVDNRPKKPSGLGNPNRGKQQRVSSNRGRQSMGGGHRGGSMHRQVRRPSGGGGRRGGGGGRRR
jgi:hypothetical protein